MLAQRLCCSFQTKELDKRDSFIVFLVTFKAKLVEFSSYDLKTVKNAHLYENKHTQRSALALWCTNTNPNKKFAILMYFLLFLK